MATTSTQTEKKMHYHLEVIMPPTDDVEGKLKNILEPFDENADEEIASGHGFWDFWVIGGRWSGNKLKATLDDEKLNKFYEELKNREVTVSWLTAGKQSLEPKSQIPMVDALWADFFPESGVSVCPLFAHSNDQYDSSSTIAGDVCKVSELPKNLKAEHVIIAKHGWRNSEDFEAAEMLQKSIWNGVTHQDTNFDGLVSSALNHYAERVKNYKPEYAEKVSVKSDWLCVTVDYHS